MRFFSKLTTIWQELDRRILNPMTSPTEITTYNEIQQKIGYTNFFQGSMTHMTKTEENS